MPRAVDRAKAATIGEAASQAQYEVLRAGREKVQQSAPRWRRVTDGNPCGFCAMVCSRGPAYRSADAAGQGRRYHAHCGCTVEPFFGDPSTWVPSPDEARFIEAYNASWKPGIDKWDLSDDIGAWLSDPANAVAQEAKASGLDLTGINAAKTTQEIGAELQKVIGTRGNVSGFDGAALDLERTRSAAEQTARMFDRYPEVNADVQVVKLGKPYAQAVGSRDGYDGSMGNLRLQISSAKLGKRSKVDEMFRHDAESGHFHAHGDTDPMSYIVSHEFGHLVDFAGRGQIAGTAPTPMALRVSAIKKQLLSDEGIVNINGREQFEWVKKNVSGYGQSNLDEQVAEAFADVIVNGDRAKPFSRLIHDEYVARLKERRG